MNREILFKAKRKDNGEWVEGALFYSYNNKTAYIIIQSKMTEVFDDGMGGFDALGYEVYPETLCQCTGLTDKDGYKIWENDIVEFEDTGEEGYEYKEGFDFQNRAKVEFAEARWSLTDFISTNSSVVDEMYNHVEFMDFWQYCKVIGNIFDNPEQLKGSEQE